MEFIKEDRWRGALLKLIVGMIVILFGVGIALFPASQVNPTFLKWQGHVYDPAAELDDEVKAITATGIEELTSEGENLLGEYYTFYIIKHTKGTSLSRSATSDPQMEKIKQHFERSTTPIDIAIIAYVGESILNDSFATYVRDGKISDTHLLILNEAPEDVVILYTMAVVVSCGGLFIMYRALKQRQRNSQAYEMMYRQYPELQNNLALLKTGRFVDEENGIVLYKDYLFIFSDYVYAFDTSNIIKIHTVVRAEDKAKNSANRTYTLSIRTLDQKHVKIPLDFSNHYQKEQFEQLYSFIKPTEG